MSESKVMVQLLRREINTNDRVLGKVHFSVQSFTPRMALRLSFIGEESVRWFVRETKANSGEAGESIVEKKGHRQLANINFYEKVFENLQPGFHSLDFVLSVAGSGLPGTLNLKWHEIGNCFANLYYFVNAELFEGTRRLAAHSEPVILVQDIESLPQEESRPSVYQVKGCCYKDYGPCTVKVLSNKLVFQFREEAVIKCELDNSKCLVAAKYIELQFVRRLTLRSLEGVFNRDTVVTSARLSGVMPGDTRLGEDAFKFHVLLNPTNDLPPTTVGNLIENSYFFRLKVAHDVFCHWCYDQIRDVKVIMGHPKAKISDEEMNYPSLDVGEEDAIKHESVTSTINSSSLISQTPLMD